MAAGRWLGGWAGALGDNKRKPVIWFLKGLRSSISLIFIPLSLAHTTKQKIDGARRTHKSACLFYGRWRRRRSRSKRLRSGRRCRRWWWQSTTTSSPAPPATWRRRRCSIRRWRRRTWRRACRASWRCRRRTPTPSSRHPSSTTRRRTPTADHAPSAPRTPALLRTTSPCAANSSSPPPFKVFINNGNYCYLTVSA